MSRLTVVGISGNLTRPSRTRSLVDAILAEVERRDIGKTKSFDIVDAGTEIGAALSRDGAPERLIRILSAIENADVLVAASPVYKASYTGLFKHLFDLLDPKALEGRHVLLAATGGSDRHALVIDHQLRPLFGFFNAHVLPISLYAANDDFDASGRPTESTIARIGRAVGQLAHIAPERDADRAREEKHISILQHVD